jgi:creatine kinase
MRFVKAVSAVEDVIKKEGYHLGYVLTCPSNLGTGIRVSVMVKLPLLSARDGFRYICADLRLQPRGGAGVDSDSQGGVWDISNSQRLGFSEVELVNLMIEGSAKLIKMEQRLENGGEIIGDL